MAVAFGRVYGNSGMKAFARTAAQRCVSNPVAPRAAIPAAPHQKGRPLHGPAHLSAARDAPLPVCCGGESGLALRRVAEYGNGWIGFNLTPDEAAAKIRRIEELLEVNGRKRSDVELAVSNSGKPISADDLKRYRDAGVEEFVVTSLRAPHTPEEAQ